MLQTKGFDTMGCGSRAENEGERSVEISVEDLPVALKRNGFV
jgi:hypothetical protein